MAKPKKPAPAPKGIVANLKVQYGATEHPPGSLMKKPKKAKEDGR